MKRALISAAILIVIAAIVYGSIKGGAAKGEKVYAETVKTKKIEAVVTAPGEVDPKFKVNISAHVIGKIEKLHFNEGEDVKKGQVLIELERPAFTAQRDSMRAQLESRHIEVARAKAQLDTAQLQFERAANLRKQGIQTQELYDQARLSLDNAKAALASAQQGVQ